ncbi:ribonucleases P/MRP protein subunit POP1 [Astyanax mexicanus]|uniref:ribonucleases P/MRP protein subunit POP1 n=1 Tax=Astyanax mexicanus TaxID=7994 RepID=UPI0020CB6352|nr:ribonucleases P/MRP protein subunit POP1 [Astyanax mexicanus]
MSGAKDRMRHKKMRNQPSNMTYSSSQEFPNGEGSGGSAGQGYSRSQHTKGPSGYGQSQQASGWVRGRQDGPVPRDEVLPKYITASMFAKARAAEVNSMLKAVSKTTGSSHVFGALPKHMRRRAMSHNTKRLPRRLRELADRMLEKSHHAGQKEKKEQSKTKSRRARRRHGNLLLEFNRRQRKNKWLETHIWHAKRFHMLKKWGYCLGERPTYKCYRASYRAMSSGCLLQDMSYYCCLELWGPEEQLMSALSRLTSKDTGPTFAAVLCVSGQREGNTLLYKADQYPHQPMGPAQFLWRPRNAESSLRQLWIWVHPTIKQELLSELQVVCQCFEAVSPPPSETPVEAGPSDQPSAPASSDLKSEPQHPGKKRKREGDGKEDKPAKKILGDGTRSPMTPVSWRSAENDIVINDLSMEIVRYRLIGPLSHAVLTETLLPATNTEIDIESTSSFWWPQHCKNKDSMSLHKQQADVFQLLKGVNSTSELPAGCVLGLTVDDPRLTLPKKRVTAALDLQAAQDVDEEQRRDLTLRGVPAPCAQTALWDQDVRDNVTNNRVLEQEMNKMKRELLVPGSRLPVFPQSRVPILLVHQAGKQQGEERRGWGSGWDLLLPKGWGMAFWVPLVYRGVRVGGLQMSLKHSQNKCLPHFPHEFPDCPAGVRFQEEQEVELLNKFKRRPPAKRTNYIKHGCLAPFRCPWQRLTEEWEKIVKQDGEEGKLQSAEMEGVISQSGEDTPPTSAFTVLRSRKVLRQLSVWSKPSSARNSRVPRGCLPTPLLNTASAMELQAQWRHCLVWVRVCVLGKGLPTLHTMLCVPTAEDLQQLRKDPRSIGPKEPRHKDHLQHLLKRRSKRRKASPQFPASEKDEGTPAAVNKDSSSSSAPKDNQDSVVTSTHPNLSTSISKGAESAVESSSATDLSDSCKEYVRGLWPEPLPSVSSHCSRVTLGWVTQGDFSLATGNGEALGFVSLTGLLHMLLSQPADQRGSVLVRNPTSLQYRYARLHVEA